MRVYSPLMLPTLLASLAAVTLQPGAAQVAAERKAAFAAPLSGITIDGRLDDWPGGLPVYKLREMAAVYGPTDVDGTDLDTSTDLSPEFMVGYSLEEQLIYVAIRVRDDRIRVGGWSTNTDACEVFLGRGTLPFQYMLCPEGGSYRGGSNPSLTHDDLGTLFHVDPDTPKDKDADGGNGSASRPFRTIQEGLDAASYGDTIRLAPGTCDQPAELISGVTLMGAGQGRTRVIGEAHFGLALRPFIHYYQPPGAGAELSTVALRDVVMEAFTFDGGEEYPPRSAEEVSDLLALVMAANRQECFFRRGPADAQSRTGHRENPVSRCAFRRKHTPAWDRQCVFRRFG